MEKTNKNILWIDYAKVIGIFLVILGHASLKFNFSEKLFQDIHLLIYTFHMPLFFIISGVLYSKKSQSENLTKIFYGLVIPYFIYQFIFLPFKFGQYMTEPHGSIFSEFLKCIFGILLGDCQNNDFSKLVCGSCWFIVCIIQIRLLFNFINTNKKTIICLSIFSVLLLKFLIIKNVDLFFCLDDTLMAIPYFSFGYIFSKYFKNIKIFIDNSKLNIVFTIVACTLIAFILLKIATINGLIEMNLKITEETAHQSLILAYIAGCLGFFMTVALSLLFKSVNKFVQKISKNTLFILFFHMLVLFILACFRFFSVISIYENLIYKLSILILTSFIILVVNYFVIIFLERYCPIALGKLCYFKKGVVNE